MVEGGPVGVERDERSGTHPHLVARVEIDADRVADRLAQEAEGADAEDVLVTVQFETKLGDAASPRIEDEVVPVGDQHIFPLIAQYRLRLGRPTGRHPIGIGIAGPARAARHHDNPLDAQQTGERDRLARYFTVAAAGIAGMNRVARAVEGADRDAPDRVSSHGIASRLHAETHYFER